MRSSTVRILGAVAMVLVLVGCLPAGPSDSDAGTNTGAADAGRDGGAIGTVDSGTPATDAGQTAEDSGMQPGADQTTDAGTGADFFAQVTLERRVGYLASDAMKGRDEGTPESALARQFIIDELTACGVAPQVSVSGGTAIFTQPIVGGDGTNVLGVVQGTDTTLRDRYVLISAHYDHVGQDGTKIYNGAQDNAASVASVLAVACAIASSPTPRSVLIALWDAEEPDTFLTDSMGSQYFSKHPTLPLISIDVAIALDLVGGNMWGTDQGHNVLGSELSVGVRTALDTVADPEGVIVRRGGLHLVEEITTLTGHDHQPWSDYDAFRNNQVPVLFFSDGQNKRYHTTSDDVSFLDFPKLVKESRFLHQVTRALGTSASTPVFLQNGNDYLRDATAVIATLDAALAVGTGLSGLSSTSKNKLNSDLTTVTAIKTKLTGGGSATSGEIQSLRSAIQRVMCHSAGQSATLCNFL